ncbi:VWA domain-containing protein [Granulicella sp. S156]|uniref:VWA domain-containing protein n=1 Tax=Granulicella sp. S156 TaxID=1747224 RepID=UPI00131B01EC|nr:VWA domain-containing protein [Granulicella sp. S156]
MSYRRHIASFALMVLPVSAASSQQPNSPPPITKINGENTLAVKVRVVAITALAYDTWGRLVGGLSKDDFLLTEDGKPQTIRYFDRDSNLPITIGLMVDTSGSQRDYAEEERRASATFLQAMLTKPNDRAFVERFDTLAVLLQPMTSDVAKLQSSLKLLTAPIPQNPKVGTLLFDAICITAQKVVSKEPGRRAIVILTDGDDDGSTNNLASAIHEAQLADVAVYSVLYTPEAFGGSIHGHTSGVDIMRQISNATGGRLFIVTTGTPIERIYAEIEADMRTQYRIGYTPPDSPPHQFHKIELKARDQLISVQARTGYYSPE